MITKKTIPDVFIIESLSRGDEKKKRYEGLILSDILRLGGKKPKYYYCDSIQEFPQVIDLFHASRYRYLHISSHASDDAITIGRKEIPYNKFSSYFKGILNNKRLFLSSCSSGNENFSSSMIKHNPDMYSIVAPEDDIYFSDAAAIWSALYTSLFGSDDSSIRSKDIEGTLSVLTELFPVSFFVSKRSTRNNTWTHRSISPT